MTAINKADFIKKMAAKRSQEQAEKEKNRYNFTQNINAMLMVGLKVNFSDKDKTKTNGTIFGYRLDNENQKHYIEVYINPDNLSDNITNKKNRGATVSGGVIDSSLESNYFPHKELARDKKSFNEVESPFLTKNTYYNSDIKEIVKELYPENEGKEEILLIVDNPVRTGSRKDNIDGEEIEITTYKINWVNFIPLGCQTTNNVYNNAIFSFQPSQYTYKDDNNKIHKIAEVAAKVCVWQKHPNGTLKATAFSDEKGVEAISKVLDEQAELQNYFLNTPEGAFWKKMYENVEKGYSVSYLPTVSFGIITNTTDEEKENSKTTKTHNQKILLLPTKQYASYKKIKHQKDENNQFERDDDGNLIPMYELDEEGNPVDFLYETYLKDVDEPEKEVFTALSPTSLAILMDEFRTNVNNPEHSTHLYLKDAYPDLDIESLNDDNFVIFFAKSYNYMTSHSVLQSIKEKYIELRKSDSLSEKQKENSWNELIYQLKTTSEDYKKIKGKVLFYDWNGNEFILEENEKIPFALKSALTTYPITTSLKNGRKGVFHAFTGIVAGSSINVNKEILYFYPSIHFVKPFNYSGRNLMTYFHATDYDGNEEEGGLFLELDMLKPIHYSTDEEEQEEQENQYDDSSEIDTKSEEKAIDEKNIKSQMAKMMNELEDDDDESEEVTVPETKPTPPKKEQIVASEPEAEVKKPAPIVEVDNADDDIPF